VVLIGHSTGGLIAARCTQLHAGALAATILSGPVLGSWAIVDQLLELEEIPSTPIDSATLSRDSAVGADDAVAPLVWHGDFVRPVPLPAGGEGRGTRRGPGTHTKACRGARHEIFAETNREEVLADVVDVVDRCWPTVDDADQMNSSGSNSSMSMIRTRGRRLVNAWTSYSRSWNAIPGISCRSAAMNSRKPMIAVRRSTSAARPSICGTTSSSG